MSQQWPCPDIELVIYSSANAHDLVMVSPPGQSNKFVYAPAAWTQGLTANERVLGTRIQQLEQALGELRMSKMTDPANLPRKC